MQEKTFDIVFLDQPYRCFYIKTPEKAAFAISKCMEKDCLFGLDTETEPLPEYKTVPMAGLSPHLAKIRLLQIFDGKNSFIFDMKFLPPAMFVEFLEAKKVIAHNAVFDLQFLMNWGAKNINIGCTYLLSRLLYHAVYPTDSGLSASLQSMVSTVFKTKIQKTLQTSNWSVPDLTFEQIEYASTDAISVLRLAQRLVSGMQRFGLERIYKLSKAAQHPIAAMQLNGIRLNINAHRNVNSGWIDNLYKAKKEVLKLTGLESLTPAKLGGWLQENLPAETLAIWPKTETGLLSTDAHTFADFSHLPIVEPFSRYQKLETLCTSFGSKLYQQVNPKTGLIHASYKLCGTRTGRLSCSKPNLQQLPREKTIRENFIPADGSDIFLCADYSQIELRVAAEVSQDQTMLRAYREGLDLHALTASRIAHKALQDVTKEERQMAKAFNFGLLFGLGVNKFSHYARKSYGLDVSKAEAQSSIDTFRTTYAGYRDWQIKQSDNAAQALSVRTPCGKLRRLDQDNCYGASMNTPIQGGASEIMLYALVRLNRFLPKHCKLVNCVHDEILVSTKPEFKDEVKGLIEGCMTDAFYDVFPNGAGKNLVECKSGKSWGEAK